MLFMSSGSPGHLVHMVFLFLCLIVPIAPLCYELVGVWGQGVLKGRGAGHWRFKG